MAKRNTTTEFSIIGTGRFGLFWGKHLAMYYPTSFYDCNPALKRKILSFGKWQTLNQCLKKDYIFLTMPISQIPVFLEENASRFKKGSVVIDCASVKTPVMAWLNTYIPDGVYYAASHPLFGPDSARIGLKDHILAIMPGRIPLQRYNFLVGLFMNTLQLNVLCMSPEEHDRLMAFNLSLVHHLGRTLHELGISKLPLRMAGLKKLAEISQIVMNDSVELFKDFYRFNPYSAVLKDNFLQLFTQYGQD